MRLALATATSIAILAAGLALFAPAALLDERLSTATGGQLRLADARGTLWRGTAIAATPEGRLRRPLRWRVEPGTLAHGELGIALMPSEPDASAPQGRIALATGGVRVETLRLSLPAGELAAGFAPSGVFAGGIVDVEANDLVLALGVESGEVRVSWNGARLALPGRSIVDLGELRAALATRDGSLRGPVRARGGSIRLDGEAALGGGGLRLTARLVPESWASPADRALLAAIGTANADGSVSVSFSGRPR